MQSDDFSETQGFDVALGDVEHSSREVETSHSSRSTDGVRQGRKRTTRADPDLQDALSFSAGLLRKGSVDAKPSAVLALMTAWAVLAVFALLAIGALDLQFAMDFVSRAFAYLPQLLIAAMLLAMGSLISSFLRRSVLIAAVNAGLPSARLLAGGAYAGLMVLFLAMAAEHLGVGRQILLVSFTLLFGGVVFALSLAFGLAGRDMARELLQQLLRRQGPAEKDDLRHL